MSCGNFYLLDANIFIEAARRYYAFDIAPCYWVALVERASENRLASVAAVKEDIDRGKDELKDWIKHSFQRWILPADEETIKAYARLMQWSTSHRDYTASAKDEFARVSDAWLIAHAMAKGSIVVTNETYDPKIRKKIKIPNACREFGVRCVNTFEMLRGLGVKFV
ncbi:MAG: DUF4411 family protein [Candidatus Methylacidiphilaceae bacterium]